MSGTVDLTSLFASLVPTSTSTNLLDIITGQSTGISDANPIDALLSAEQNQTKDIAQTAQQTSVQRDVAAFTAAVTGATSVKQLLSNVAFQKVFLTASDLGTQIGDTALNVQALMSDPTNTASLANQLSSSVSGYLTAAKTYNFYSNGLATIQKPSVISTLANAYAEVTWRTSLDAATPGLSNALTFRSEASTITSVDQILGDSVMRNVVTTTLGLPEQIAFQPLEAQESAISSRLDITQFQDPKFVESFVDRYLLATQAANSTTGSTTDIATLAAQLNGLTV